MCDLSWELIKHAEKHLNVDPFVKNNIKFYRLKLVLISNQCSYCLIITDGMISASTSNGSKYPEVVISGSSEDWAKIIKGMHGGMHRAFRHKILQFKGDSIVMLSIWKTIWRLGESLVKANEEDLNAL